MAVESNAFDLKSIAQSLLRLSEDRQKGDDLVYRRSRVTAFSSHIKPAVSKRRPAKNRFVAPTVVYDSESDEANTSTDSALDTDNDANEANSQRMQMATTAPSLVAAIDADDIAVAMTLGSLNHLYELQCIELERERIDRLNHDVADAITDASTSLIALSKSRLRLMTDSIQQTLGEVQSQSRAQIADEVSELSSIHQTSERRYADKVHQLIAAEEEARREAERQARIKAEADARAEQARRAAEERKREDAAAAAAATAAANAQAQAKAAAEAKAKAAAEEKKKTASLISSQPGQQPPSTSTLSPADAAAAAAASQAAQAEMQPRIDLLNQFRREAANFQPTNPQQKLQIKVIVNRTITQISGTQQSILQKANILINQINQSKNINTSAYCYTMELIATKLVSSGESRIATQTSIAYPIAQVVLLLSLSDNNFNNIFLAALTERCVYIIPLYLDRKSYNSMSQYKQALGYASSTEDEEKYFERMSGYIALYAAYVQSQPPQNQANVIHPHGITYAWKWLARLCNHEPRTATAAILHTFLSVAGYILYQTYTKQIYKIFYYIINELIPRMDNKTPARNAAIIRLKLWLNETNKLIVAGKNLNIPEGQNIPFTQSSDAAVQVIQRGD